MGRKKQRGMTLLEAVIAIGVLAIGFLGIAALLTSVSAATRKSAFHNYALDVYTAFAAQVQNAKCDFAPSTPTAQTIDTGLLAAGAWHTAPVAASELSLVGLINALDAAAGGKSVGATAPVYLAYQANLIPGDCPTPCNQPDSYFIQVSVCDASDPANPCAITGTAGYNNQGYMVRSFELTKTCTVRLDDNGRGEFY
jgi:Tfp pilus assembly protein PilV